MADTDWFDDTDVYITTYLLSIVVFCCLLLSVVSCLTTLIYITTLLNMMTYPYPQVIMTSTLYPHSPFHSHFPRPSSGFHAPDLRGNRTSHEGEVLPGPQPQQRQQLKQSVPDGP